MPSYDAILVPDPAYDPFRTLPIMQNLAAVVPGQPPKRRRPILAVIDLLQKRYGEQQKKKENKPEEGQESVASSEVATESNPASEPNTNATKDTSVCAEDSVTDNVNETANDQSNNTNKSDSVKSTDVAAPKVPQAARIYSLLENLMKSHPDVNDGFSYAFKYSVPSSQTKLDQVAVSVQQSLKNFPEIPDDPLHGFKTPIDYKKAQAKLDFLLEDSTRTGGPMHLNTPGAFGPLLLNEYVQQQQKDKQSDSSETVEAEVVETTEKKEDEGKPTKLVLRPVAKAVAGPRGIAVASPIAKAVLRRGQNVELDYDPDAVAIAGPGGRAHAHPQFSIDYLDSKEISK